MRPIGNPSREADAETQTLNRPPRDQKTGGPGVHTRAPLLLLWPNNQMISPNMELFNPQSDDEAQYGSPIGAQSDDEAQYGAVQPTIT
jgi:hypothetical protein